MNYDDDELVEEKSFRADGDEEGEPLEGEEEIREFGEEEEDEEARFDR